jgi:hypothetical protein
MAVTHYMLVSAVGLKDKDAQDSLVKQVRAEIALGWEPQGGAALAVSLEGGEVYPYFLCQQAMVKRD